MTLKTRPSGRPGARRARALPRHSPRLVAAAALLAASAARAQTPVGNDFLVNGYVTGNQIFPAVAADAEGNFVVAWQSLNQDGSAFGIFARAFDAAGSPRGGEFQVNTFTANTQRYANVTPTAGGDFVVVWQSFGQDGQQDGIFRRRVSGVGSPVGGEFQVNTWTTSYQFYPAVASDPDGNVIVAWQSLGQDGSGLFGVYGRRYDGGGTAQGAEFPLHQFTTGQRLSPALAAAADGSFVAVWESERDGSSWGVFGRRFDAMGNPLGGEFQVNVYTTDAQRFPAVASDAAGNFVVVWRSFTPATGYDVFGRRFTAAGTALGGEFQVNTLVNGIHNHPAVAADPSGAFIVVWTHSTVDGSFLGVGGRLYDASGRAVGGDFAVNSHTTANQYRPSAGWDGRGRFVVAWQSYAQDGSGLGIFARRFTDVVFANGFQ